MWSHPDSYEYRQGYVIVTVIGVMGAVFGFFGIMDWYVGYTQLARDNFLNLIMTFIVALILYRTHNITLSGYLVLGLYGYTSGAFLMMVGYYYYGYIWLILFAPIAFFLLPLWIAMVVSLLYYGYFITIMISLLPYAAPAPFGFESVLNIAIALLALMGIVAYFRHAHEVVYARLQTQNVSLARMAMTDPLTGLLNRLTLYQNIRLDTPIMSFVMIDLDDFKHINDTYGHAMGDEVLIVFSSLILDLGYQSARFGGEEFGIVMADHPLDRAHEQMRHLQECIRPIHGISYTASIGIAQWDGQESFEALIHRADEAMYEAKHQGKNRIILART